MYSMICKIIQYCLKHKTCKEYADTTIRLIVEDEMYLISSITLMLAHFMGLL